MNYKQRRMLEDDIRCHNIEKADIRFHDGALPHAKGACCYQVIRASKNIELSPEGRGFTYNHGGMLTYFNGTFIYEYIGGPNGEHEAPSAVYVSISKDGIHWGKPREAFPSIKVDCFPYIGPKKDWLITEQADGIVHHRMGFYTSSDNRLLMTTFYGLSPDSHTAPNNGYGVGRVVREIYSDLSMSDIYFLRYNIPGGYTKENATIFPFFEQSQDEGFRKSCRELLSNRLVTQQWWEEERLDEIFFTRPGGRALSYYTLENGRVMGVFKDSLTSYTDDGGEHWSPLKKSVSIETSSGKVWGQKTSDGKYALVYNPSPDGAHRWPLAMVTGDNGVDFDSLTAIVPEVSPCRYEGKLKNLGPQYVRGITEANGKPDDQAMWIVYSMNKEDMWISRVPVSVVSQEYSDVTEIMSEMTEEMLRNNWNLYVPAWNTAQLCDDKDGSLGLRLTDCDPYNRTRAMRLFKPGIMVEISAKLKVESLTKERISMFIQDRKGQNISSIVICPDGQVYLHNGGFDTYLCNYEVGKELILRVLVDCVENQVKITALCDGEGKTISSSTAASVFQAERILFSTKYDLPWQGLEINGKLGTIGNLPDADQKHELTSFCIMELRTHTIEEK